mgnify:CR=1 FL=1
MFILPGVSSGSAAYLIEQSLLFNDGDSAYLNRTPSVAGNRKTWTFSCWVKRASSATNQNIFGAYSDGNNRSQLFFASDGTLYLQGYNSGSWVLRLITNQTFQDFSTWYHIVAKYDSTPSTPGSSDIQLWVNGTQVTGFSTETYPSQNTEIQINNTVQHGIGRYLGGTNYYDGLMALPILVDGAAQAPTAFGETDDDGFWNPIEYTGSYGTNGFQLNFEDTTEFGKDVSSTRTALTATYVTSVSNDGGGGFATSPVTFSSVDIGTASANRKVIVGVGIDGYQGNEAYTSLTIGGVAANLIQEQNAASGGRPVALYELDVASGTSADIVVTFTGTQTKCYSMGIGVWTIEGGSVFDTVGATTDPGAGNVEIPAGGAVIAIMTEGNASATYAWANLTENFDNQVRASRQAFSGASKNLSSTTTQAISSNVSGGSQFAMLAASFAPGNDYVANNFTASDQLEDTPTDSADDGIGNFAVWDAGRSYLGNFALEEGNTKIVATAQDFGVPANIGVTSGKWYWEITALQLYCYFGIVSEASMGDTSDGSVAQFDGYGGEVYIYGRAGMKVSKSASQTAYGDSFTTNDVIGVAFDADNGTIWFSKNGTWQNSATTGEITAGTTTNAAYSSIDMSDYWYPHAHLGYTGDFCIANFGQKPFAYTPPTGFSAIATQNLPAPTIADGSQYFNTVLYTGNGTAIGSGGNAITGVGFQPDFVWIKGRDTTFSHQLYDVIRGAEKPLNSNNTGAEGSNTEVLTAFTSDGFTVGSNSGVNQNTKTYVGWCWKAGGSASSNTDGSITTSVSANPTAGFSIISYTGNATAGATLGHGLSSAPKFILAKNRDDGVNAWAGYHVALGGTHRIFLNTNAAAQDDDGNWYDTNPSSSVVTLGNGGISNKTGDDFIMYAWAEVEGFSKFGSYTGNGSADGPFVYTGFRSAFVMTKRTNSTGDWRMHDTARVPYNPFDGYLRASTTEAELSGGDFDFLSNGFKIRNNGGESNASGGAFIYMAFAEHPFQGADGVTQARAR